MKFQYVSDLHREFSKVNIEALADTLILAGDIGIGCSADWIKEHCSRFKYVVMVCGNHEFYNQNMHQVIADYVQLSNMLENFYFLEKDIVELDGIKIAGGTMWTPVMDSQYLPTIQSQMNDFHIIGCGEDNYTACYRKFSPGMAQTIFEETKQFLEDNVPDIVITHHAPHPHSVVKDPRYANSKLNDAYFADMSDYLETNKVVWIHGHIHASVDYMVGDSRVIANPRGYFDNEGHNVHDGGNLNFDMLKYFEVNK